jgi:hypothetical protein
MNADSGFFFRFYGSIVVGAVLITMAFLLKGSKKTKAGENDGDQNATESDGSDESTVILEVPLLPFIKLPWKFKRSSVLRGTLLLGALFLFWQAASVDFAHIFPSRMRMDVFYDLPGIKRTLTEFSPAELRAAAVAPNWESRLPAYDEVIRRHLSEAWRRTDPSSATDTVYIKRENLHARGETSFSLERLGFLEYRLRESQGSLDQIVEAPGAPLMSFRTSFNLRGSPNDYVRSTVPQLLRTRAIIMRPEFTQAITVDAKGAAVQVDHIIMALTKVHLWYYPRFNQTLYLWIDRDGKTVPIGYAIYSEN